MSILDAFHRVIKINHAVKRLFRDIIQHGHWFVGRIHYYNISYAKERGRVNYGIDTERQRDRDHSENKRFRDITHHGRLSVGRIYYYNISYV